MNGLISTEPDIESMVLVHDMSPYATCFTPDGQYQIYGSWDNNCKLRFTYINKGMNTTEDNNFEINLSTSCPVVKITADGSIVAAGGSWENLSYASKIFLINMSTRKIDRQIDLTHQYFEISPDGKYIAAIDNRSASGIYWTSNNTLFKKFSRDYGLLKFSPDGRYLITSNSLDQSHINIFKFPEMTIVYSTEGKPNYTLSPNREGTVSWSPDGFYLALIIGSQKHVKIIETDTWKVVCEISNKNEKLNYNFVSFSPEGGWLAIGVTNMEERAVSLGLQIYETTDWYRIFDEPKQLEYNDYFKDNNLNNDKYAIFDSISWFSENWLYLSATMYKGTIVLSTDTESDDTEPDEPTILPLNQNINFALIFGTGIAVISILGILSVLSYLGYLPNPLYTKLKREELQNQLTRNKIMSYVQTHPGCNFPEIRRSLESSSSNLYYHLSVLEREDLIFSKVLGLKRMFYSSDYPKFSDRFPDTAEQGIHERIFLLLLNNPGLTQKDIAGRLKVSEATVSRYIIDLLTEDFISRERDGKVWRCYAKLDTTA
jgi:predicted transcriptional regulator